MVEKMGDEKKEQIDLFLIHIIHFSASSLAAIKSMSAGTCLNYPQWVCFVGSPTTCKVILVRVMFFLWHKRKVW